MRPVALALVVNLLACSTLAAQAKEAGPLIDKGWEALKKTQAKAALTFFSLAVEKDRNSSMAHLGKGKALKLLGRHEEALKSLQRAAELKSSYPHLNLELGSTLYYLKRFDKALPYLETYEARNPDSWIVHELLGLSYFQTKAYERAIEALTHKSLREIKRHEAMYRYYVGLSYASLKKFDKAKEYFQKIIEEDADSIYAVAARKALVSGKEEDPTDLWAYGRMKGAEKRKWFYVTLGLDASFDTNPLSLGDDSLIPGSFVDRETVNLETSAGLGVNLIQTRSTLWNAEFRFQTKHHHNLANFDRKQTSYSTSFEHWVKDWIGGGLSFSFSEVRISNDDTFEVWTLGPHLYIVEAPWTRTRLFHTFARTTFVIDFQDPAIDLDSETHTFGISQELLVPDTKLYLNLGVSGTRQNTDGPEFDANIYSFFVQASHPLYWGLRLSGSFSWTGSNFDISSSQDPPGSGGRERYDDRWTTSFFVQRTFYDIVTFYLRYTHVKNDSNIGLFEYSRDIYSVGFTLRY